MLFFSCDQALIWALQIYPASDANEIQIPYKHHKVSSLVKRHQSTHNSIKYEVIWKCHNPAKREVLIKQYLRSILDISGALKKTLYVIYQTRETVFHRDTPNTENRVENTTRNEVFLTKFEVFG